MTEAPRIASSSGPPPHAYDPDRQPEYFEGVLARRLIAFLIDVVIIVAPIVVLAFLILILGFLTLGFGWILFFLLSPILVIWALLYTGLTLSSKESATLGMRAVDLELRTWYGAPMYFLLACVHVVFFWVLTTSLTPLILVVGLLNRRRRLLHDFLSGTVMINNEARAARLRRR